MGYFDDIVRPDSTPSYVATPPGVPRITVRPSFETRSAGAPQNEGIEPPAAPPQLDDMSADVGFAPDSFEPWGAGEAARGNVPSSPRIGALFDDIVAPAAQHKAAIERALSTTVPLRLQHPRPVEIASELMADHGMLLDEALDRATMRLHAEEGTAEAGKISDVIGKDAFDEAQRAPAPSDLAQSAPGVGQGAVAAEEQARPDGEHASGDSAPQGGDAAGEKTIGSEGTSPADNRAQSHGPAPRVAREGLSPPAPEPSLLSRLASPVTDIPHEIYEAGAESLGAVNTYLNPFSDDYREGLEAERDKWVGTGPGSFLGTGKGLLAAAGVPFSPAAGVFRSLIGHPFSVIIPTATPEQQEKMRQAGVSEDMIPGQTREENYQKIKRDVDLAMMALAPRGFTPRGPIPSVGPPPAARPPDTAAAQSDRMTSEARESGPSSFEDEQQGVDTGNIAAVTRNALKGRAFEEEELRKLAATHTEIRRQVTVRPYVDASGTLADYTVRLDAISFNEKGVLQLTDFKSSEKAGYTKRQRTGYPQLEEYGGQVVGENGGKPYPHGFQIRRTKVTIIRPPKLTVER